jgi:hypothetical protein
MAQQEGFEIYGRFYPFGGFRMGDPVLIREVTGMSWPQFTSALADQEDEIASLRDQGELEDFEPDAVLLVGLMAVAFWHGNQQMSRAKVVKAVERIPIEDVKYIAGDEDEADVSPPAETGAAGATPSTTSSGSGAPPEAGHQTEAPPGSTSDETNPNGSGSPVSPNAPLESLPA